MRRVARAAAWAALAAVALSILGSAVFRIYAESRWAAARQAFEERIGPLDQSLYVPPVAPDVNAARWLTEGATALALTEEEVNFIGRRFDSLGEPWSPTDDTFMSQFVERHRSALEALGRAASLETSSFDLEYMSEVDPQIEEPGLFDLLRAGRALAVLCGYREQRNELDSAILALVSLERLAAASQREPTLLMMLLGISMENAFHDRLESLLRHLDDEASLRRIDGALEHLEREALDPLLALAVELGSGVAKNLEFYDYLVDPSTPEDPLTRRLFLFLRRSVGGPEYVAANSLEHYLSIVLLFEGPLASDDWPARWEEWKSERESEREYVSSLIPNLLVGMQRAQRTLSARALARSALHLRRERLRGVPYPVTLVDAPTSPYTGEEMRYTSGPVGVELSFPKALAAQDEDYAIRVPSVAPPRLATLCWRLPAD